MKHLLFGLFFLLSYSTLSAQLQYGQFLDQHYRDWLRGTAPTYDGGSIAVGLSHPRGVGAQPWIVRLDVQGDTLWTQSIWIDTFRYSVLHNVQETADSGFIASGDNYYVKTDRQGQVEWDYLPPLDSLYDRVSYNAVRQTADGGYLLVGDSTSGPYRSFPRLLRLDAQGNRLWQRTFDFGGDCSFNNLFLLPNGDFMVSGGRKLAFTSASGLIQRYDAQGNARWSKTWIYSVRKMVPAADSGYWFLSGAGQHLGKISPQGDSILHWELRDTAYYTDLTLAADGGIILMGSRYNSPYDIPRLSKIDTAGHWDWQRSFPEPNGDLEFFDFFRRPNGRLMVVGLYTVQSPRFQDGYWAEFDPEGQLLTVEAVQTDHLSIQVYPNPAIATVHIVLPETPTRPLTAQLLNLQGQPLRHFVVTDPQTTLDVETLPAGIYLLQIMEEATGRQQVYKIVKP